MSIRRPHPGRDPPGFIASQVLGYAYLSRRGFGSPYGDYFQMVLGS